MFDTTQLGNKIRRHRHRLNLTQTALAEQINVSFQAVSGWETGATLPDIENLCRLALLFGCSVDTLLQGRPAEGEPVMIGVDGGGTKSEFALFTARGRILKTFRLPGTNAGVAGIEEALGHLCRGIDLCLAEVPAVAGIFIGNAGPLEELKRRLPERYPKIPIRLESDGVNALSSGDGTAALICGTGSILILKEEDHYRRIGGWGYRLGDPGSAYNFGREALRAAMLYEDGIANEPLIHRLLLEKTGAPQIRSTFTDKTPSYIGSLAFVVFEAYRAGDETAEAIIRKEMQDLAVLIRAACPHGGELVAVGGMIEHYQKNLLPILKEYLPADITFILPGLPPIYGACVACCRWLETEPNEQFKAQFQEDYAEVQNPKIDCK